MKTLKIRIQGTAPMLMHNGRLANPLDDIAKEMKEVSSKRKKTDEDHIELARLEFLGSLYLDDKAEPCIPADLVEAMVIEGAKLSKLGTQFKAAVFCDADSFPLNYKGPRKPDGLWEDPKFRDIRGVKVQRARVMRCRPMFRNWSSDIEVTFNPELVNQKQVEKAVRDAGVQKGLGDYRPRFGRFTVESVR